MFITEKLNKTKGDWKWVTDGQLSLFTDFFLFLLFCTAVCLFWVETPLSTQERSFRRSSSGLVVFRNLKWKEGMLLYTQRGIIICMKEENSGR